MSALETLLNHYRETAKNERDKGDKFEHLTKFFLENDSRFTDRFSDVWIWNKFPLNEGKVDTGIDLVAKEKYSEGYCAIQCKFYADGNVIDKSNIDSFFTASGKSIYTSRLIFATTNNWTKHAEDALKNQKVPVNRITTADMETGSIDWSQFDPESFTAPQLKKKGIRDHQQKALESVIKGFQNHARGKLVMACGTGKTFTSLKIAEKIGGNVLFLAPSISLINQTFNEWIIQASQSIASIIVCSDKSIKAEENDDIYTYDLVCPPTTNTDLLVKAAQKEFAKDKLNVVFSTYQSIEVVIEAQEKGLPEFDVVICDEAHRTTGVTLSDREDSHFTKIHDANLIKSKRRLYMTATPKIYADSLRAKASQEDADVFSMDDENLYGPQFHYLGFGEAVEKGLLSDYKVMVLGVDEDYASKFLQQDNELQIDDDQIKIIGCWNGLAKKLVDNGISEGNPMRRAVAFSRSIKDSKKFTELFSKTVKTFVEQSGQEGDLLECDVDHVDGSMSSIERQKKLKWLKEDTASKGNICRILSNAKCLSEGVDVPTLDAVLFLNPRNSIVDVVQSVGRAMRKAEGKNYGYIIIPISIPADVDPEKALNDNKRYKVVWDVCQALRAHDDRFEATVNKIKFNVKKPDQIDVTIIGGGSKGVSPQGMSSSGGEPAIGAPIATQLKLDLPTVEAWQNAILGKIAKKCGTRDYWENWAKDVSEIAEKHIDRINLILKSENSKSRKEFDRFLKGLQKNINPAITEADGVEMLAQHLITKPVFDALFEGYSFADKNPVSKSIQKVLEVLQEHFLEEESKKLEGFYESVRKRVSGIDNATAKQIIIKELYDKFFNTAFPKVASRLGIVYTPIEVVDFIIKHVNHALKENFDGATIGDKGVHVLDPFTGTGTFIVRLLQSGLIKKEDLLEKYKNNIHANELVLLAYYIAAINIEETYHDISESHEYLPFDGIVLTDTFQLSESKSDFEELMFPENNSRVKKQNSLPIKVIFGNPPYSVGQESINDDAANIQYPKLDSRISETYLALSSTKTGKRSAYDSYIRAIRWASDRIGESGVIGFITNSGFIEKPTSDGLRKSLQNEFTNIYVINLRGDIRKNILSKGKAKEGQNIFGAGSMTGIAITILVKNPDQLGSSKLWYCDIGDDLSTVDKLEKLKNIESSFESGDNVFTLIKPNEMGDWSSQRDLTFKNHIILADKSGLEKRKIFNNFSLGVVSNRDAWVYNFSKKKLADNCKSMIDFYNQEIERFKNSAPKSLKPKDVQAFVQKDTKRISWGGGNWQSKFAKFSTEKFEPETIRLTQYRPFVKQWHYGAKTFNHSFYSMPLIFPDSNSENLVITVSGVGARSGFSTLMVSRQTDLQMMDNGQCFPLYLYPKAGQKDDTKKSGDLFSNNEIVDRESAISTETLFEFRSFYKNAEISAEDIFFYVYGIFHSKEYIDRFSDNLSKEMPRIPMVKSLEGFKKFSDSGKKLSELHVNYENVEGYPLIVEKDFTFSNSEDDYKISRIQYKKVGKEKDLSTLIYNDKIKISGIPLEAHNYLVSGKSPIDWVVDRYAQKLDKDSEILNDCNDWGLELGALDYPIELVKKVVTVSLETLKLINSLPPLDI